MSRRLPGAELHGFDVTPAMLDHAKTLDYQGQRPALTLGDISAAPLPLDDSSVDLVSISALLHLFDDPFPVLAEIRRLLRGDGTLLVYDWVRSPLQTYIERGPVGQQEASPGVRRARAMKLFAVHNRYTIEDWRWVLSEAGFGVRQDSAPGGDMHRLFVTSPGG